MRGWVVIVAAAGCFHITRPEAEDDAGEAVSDAARPVDATDAAVDALLSDLLIEEVEDTFLHLANPTFNHGAGPRLCVDLDDARVALLRFNLSTVPAGATVVAAGVRIFTSDLANSDGSVDPYTFHEMLEPWVEGTLLGAPGQASWNERALGTPWISAGAGPGSRAVGAAGTFTPVGIDAEFAVPLAPELVQRWLETPDQNRGLALVTDSADGACFVSSEGLATAKRPALRLTVATP